MSGGIFPVGVILLVSVRMTETLTVLLGRKRDFSVRKIHHPTAVPHFNREKFRDYKWIFTATTNLYENSKSR